MTEPVTRLPRRAADPVTANEWLEAVATGAIDRAEFLRGVSELLHRAPDAGWEILALLDQYYRRGKITRETFGSLKTHLQDLLMGKNGGDSVRGPRAVPSASSTTAFSVTDASHPVATPRRDRLRPVPAAAPEAAAAPPPIFAKHEADDDDEVAAPAHTERTLKPGDVLRGRYRVEEVLGQGGMGTVFGAVDLYRVDRAHSDQRVAIKVLHSAVVQRPRLFTELRREFQHLQSLSHPNIVRVHEFDRDDDIAFFTMERLSGALLSRVLAANRAAPLYRPYAIALIRDVGAAVVHAHAHGVIHGDLNPVNIFVTDQGEVRVLDFGAASPLRRGPWISEFENSQQMAVATPSYASCELLEGETPDARDDVYALACVAYVLLTGKHPFRDHTALKARSARMKPSRPSGLSRGQWNALRAGLYFDRARRPSDIRAWVARLGVESSTRLPILPELFKPRAMRGTRMVAAAAATAAVAGVAAIAWWLNTHPDDTARFSASLRHAWNPRQSGSPERDLTGESVPSSVPAALPDHAPAPSATGQQPSDLAKGVSAAAPPAAAAPAAAAQSSAAVPARNTSSSVPVARAPVSAAAASAVAPAALAATAAPITPVHARIELAADTVDVQPGEATAQVVIRRSRSLRGDVAFTWWTESGTAKPGRDFVPVKSEVEHMPEGKNSLTLLIPIVVDPARRDSRSFYVVIDEPSDNAALGPRTLTMVTVPGLD